MTKQNIQIVEKLFENSNFEKFLNGTVNYPLSTVH